MSGRGWPLAARLARPDDRDAVMAFATNTWNGWDYMPHAWDRWLEEHDGVMLIGAVGGDNAIDADGSVLARKQVVAVVRVAMPATGEAWLEGIRVDPRVRGLDIATDLQVAELAWAEANGAGIVRYATSAANEGSHRLGARGGLELVVTLLGVSREAGQEQGEERERSGFEPEVQAQARRQRHAVLARLAGEDAVAGAELTEQIWHGLAGDVTFNAGERLYEPRPWALEELTESKFREHVGRGEVLRAGDDNGTAFAILVADVAPAEDATLRLALVSGAPEAAFNLVERVRRAADGAALRFRYPAGAPTVEAVRQSYLDAGYELSDWAMHIMSRSLDEANPAPPVHPARLVLMDTPYARIVPAQ
jgi:GNAT superfamily N-acetyltransferase